MRVKVQQNYGELKVFKGDKAISGVYVKVFVRVSSNARFYKDGYTDIRGKFDYAHFTGTTLSGVSKFALLVTHPEWGSLMQEVDPPVGTAPAKETEVVVIN